MSYINNLHPERHEALYSVIEKIISAAFPLWNKSLQPFDDSNWFDRKPRSAHAYQTTRKDKATPAEVIARLDSDVGRVSG